MKWRYRIIRNINEFSNKKNLIVYSIVYTHKHSHTTTHVISLVNSAKGMKSYTQFH